MAYLSNLRTFQLLYKQLIHLFSILIMAIALGNINCLEYQLINFNTYTLSTKGKVVRNLYKRSHELVSIKAVLMSSQASCHF